MIVKAFNYLYDFLELIQNKKEFKINEFNFLGSRKSGKTLSAVEILVLATCLNTRIRIYVFRKMVQDIEIGIWTEFKDKYQEFGLEPYFNMSKKRIHMMNSIISFHGLHDRNKGKIKLLGLAGANQYDYIFILADEQRELSEQDKMELREAIRGRAQVIWIGTSNPWSISNWYIDYCNKTVPINKTLMMENGEQLQVIKNKLFHYTNYTINDLLSKEDYNQLEELKVLNPTRAITACYGLPGIEHGAIYAHCLTKVSRFIQPDLVAFQGGLDFGFTKDATALVVMGWTSHFSTINIIDEYYHSNRGVVFKDNERQVKDIVNKCVEIAQRFPVIQRLGMIVYADTSNYTMIELLNKWSMTTGVANWLTFKPCKKIAVPLRVGFQLALLEASRVNVDMKCENFWRELQLARWDENKKEQPVDEDNHTQDAFHYAFIPLMNYIKLSLNKFLF